MPVGLPTAPHMDNLNSIVLDLVDDSIKIKRISIKINLSKKVASIQINDNFLHKLKKTSLFCL